MQKCCILYNKMTKNTPLQGENAKGVFSRLRKGQCYYITMLAFCYFCPSLPVILRFYRGSANFTLDPCY